MPQNTNINCQQLNDLMKERGKKIIERFDSIIFSDISSPDLLSILEEVKIYWKDWVRPAITSFSCEAVGGRPKVAENASLLFSIVASGIGIHDDIIDNSSTKHFKWTIFGTQGKDKALIVGDLLFVKGWTFMIHDMIRENIQPATIAKIAKEYGKYCIQMCEAEINEISCRSNLDTDLDSYKKNVLWNLNADLEGCAKLGAILGGGSKKEVKALADFGRYLGFIHALISDLKDCVDIDGNLSLRLKNESIPFPILHSTTSSIENTMKIKSILNKSKINPTDLQKIFLMCFESKSFDNIKEIVIQSTKEASARLQSLAPSTAKKILLQMVKNRVIQVNGLYNYACELQAYFSTEHMK